MLRRGTAVRPRNRTCATLATSPLPEHTMSPAVPFPVVRSFHHATCGAWSHVVVDAATLHAAIIDPVLDFDASSGRISCGSACRLLEYIATAGLTIDWILETHAHADHLTAGAWLRERTQAKLALGAGIVEVQRTFKRLLDLGDEFVADGAQFDRLFEDGDTFAIGDLDAHVIATPGHTPDGVSYRVGDAVFVGDTLFAPHAGTARCDFPGGDAAALYRSIGRLYALPDTTRVFLCHDYPAQDAEPFAHTTIATQKDTNLHARAATTQSDYVAMRTGRDATLAPPKLLWPALQFNIRGGRLPPAESSGRAYLKLPVAFDAV
jgi:glyoxylase-like metal-dependent hydrolase (beta-lactamase superfamily II)